MPKKALLLTNLNFSTKVNPSRKYPACKIDTANLFDVDGNPIFNFDFPTFPDSTATPSSSTKTNKNSTNKLNFSL